MFSGVRFQYTLTAVIIIITTETCVISFLLKAFEENGGPHSEVPGSERGGFHHTEQVPEIRRRGERAGGTRPMLPAADPPIPGQQLRFTPHFGVLSAGLFSSKALTKEIVIVGIVRTTQF